MKNYSIFAHALHSRLQMIRNKIDYKAGLSPSELYIRNQKYFERASQSVEQHHNFKCGRSEYYEAAELFIMVAISEDETIKKQPMWTVHKNDFYVVEIRGADKDEWNPVTDQMENGKIKKMAYKEAMELYRNLCKRISSVYLRVNKYQPSSPT